MFINILWVSYVLLEIERQQVLNSVENNEK